MDTTQTRDPFTGAWDLSTFPAQQLDIAFDGQRYSAKLPGSGLLALEKDEWNNLKGDGLCLSLHGRAGRLFGLYRSPSGVYTPVAASRRQVHSLLHPPCGEDWDGFGRLIGRDFTIRVMQASMPVPVGPEDQVRLEKKILPIGYPSYEIGALRDGGFAAFDQLCPDRENGTLNSSQFGSKRTLRNVSLWQDRDGKDIGVFSMVAIGTEALQLIESRSGEDEDLFALGVQLALLPFEVRCLLALVKAKAEGVAGYGPGDPMIVWGADDGGG